MTIAVMQPYLFPYLGYFQLIHAVDRFVIYDDVNYIKKGWVNRNNLLEGTASSLFTVPLLAASQNKKINEIEVSDEGGWQDKLMRRVNMNYGKAPHFSTVVSLIEDGIRRKGLSIASYNEAILRDVTSYMGLDTTIIGTSAGYDNSELKGPERILDICQQEGAEHYINPVGGMELYDRPSFQEKGVRLSFLRSQLPAYQQAGAPFVPGLSIIDVLMYNDAAQIRTMLDQYELL